jgi:type VI protein secretion system component VasF
MNPLLAITMLVFGTVAGAIGWRRTTKYVYRRSVYAPDIPEGISRQDHERAVRRRRKRWRVVVTFFYAIAGALLGVLFLMLLGRR